jgi:hypothetical protein
VAAVEERGFRTRLNQPGLLWQVVALERTMTLADGKLNSGRL